MATKSTPPPPVKAEHKPTPRSETIYVKPDQEELTNTNTITTNPPSKDASENHHQQHPPPSLPRQAPQVIDSVTELRNLSTALSAFQRRYDELLGHLDFIRTTIDSKLPKDLNTIPSPQNQLEVVPVAVTETPSSNTAETPFLESANSEGKPNTENSSRSELERLCETMCNKGLRRYLVSHLSDINRLREEVPKALKCAPNPARLVLECSGRFFLQGSRAYNKDSPMIAGRDASILALELFLLMGCDGVEIEKSVKEEAELAALAWRKRLRSEGGLDKTSEIDARGLLLYIGCFGIPGAFTNEDVRNLIRSSNATEISSSLRRSSVLLAKIPEIIEGLLKNEMEIEALDIVYTFELEDRFPSQNILTSFLSESKETWKRTRKAAQGTFAGVNEANRKKLADLKSVIKCLEDHKIDPSKLLPGWQINEKILRLEKDIADLDKKKAEKVILKRKADEIESSKNLKTQEVKRSRFASHVPQHQKAAGHANGRSPYDGLTQMNSLDGLPAYINSYSASTSVLHGSGAGSLPENIAGSSGGGLLAAGVSVAAGHVLPTGSYAGVHGGVLDTVGGRVLPTGSYAVAHGGMLDTVGQLSNHNGQSYGWYGDASLNERLVGRTYAGQPSSVGFNGLYEPSTGLPNHQSVGFPGRSSASDLYRFADSVVESDPYLGGGSRQGGTVPPVVPAHHSSYLY